MQCITVLNKEKQHNHSLNINTAMKKRTKRAIAQNIAIVGYITGAIWFVCNPESDVTEKIFMISLVFQWASWLI